MALDSYLLSRTYSYSNPQKEMLREKKAQINDLYELAADREDDALLNGKPFVKSPRIFDRKFVDSTHHKITVETLADCDVLECGDYLSFDGIDWLCLNSYRFHGLYYKATFMSCNWNLYWCDSYGNVKTIPCIDQNSTQYNSGESESKTMTIGSAQHMLRMQCTDDTVLFDTPMRFFLDKNMKEPSCYEVTQNDNSAYNYGKGICCVTVMQTEANKEVDKLVTLNKYTLKEATEDDSPSDIFQVWIADYPSHTAISSQNQSTILSHINGRNELKIGFSRTYTVSFTDENGDTVDTNLGYHFQA